MRLRRRRAKAWAALALVAAALQGCGSDKSEDSVQFEVQFGFRTELNTYWALVVPEAPGDEPSGQDYVPVLVGNGDVEKRESFAIVPDTLTGTLDAIAEAWTDRVQADLGAFKRETADGKESLTATGPVSASGREMSRIPEGDDQEVLLAVVRLEGSSHTWIVQCTAPSIAKSRCPDVVAKLHPARARGPRP